MKHYKVTIQVSVSDIWIEDGFVLTDRAEEIEESILNMLPYAYPNEITAEVQVVEAVPPSLEN